MSADVGCTTRLRFAVDVDDVRPWEFVLVTGSLPELGGWDIQKSFALTQDTERKNRWRGYVDTSATQIEFRYFVAYKLAGEAGERLIIERWECFRNPRSVIIKNEQRGGECRANHVDLFGYYAGSKLVSEGWLQYADESQILLRIHGKALKFFKTVKERKDCRIKVTPLDVRNKQSTAPPMLVGQGIEEEEDEDENSVASTFPSHSTTVVSILSNTNSKFQRQSETGVIFNNNVDYIVFKTHSVAVEFLAFYVEIFSDEGKRIGACYALPSSLSDTFGATQLPFINSSGRPIGQISLEYLFVNTIKVPSPTQTMAVSYCRHWKKRTTIEVGHRGAGNSYTKFATARENTIYSLNMAAKNGADFVEFDVQLTKDKVAIIYHDFHVLVSVTKRAPSIMDLSGIALTDRSDDNDRKGTDFHEIAVKDLRLQQLKLLMLDHVEFPHKKGTTVKKLVEESDEEDDFKPFPTLVEALGKVDPDVGFNVEVKYPMMQKNGVHECDHYFERNEFVDIIVSDILNKAGDRRIMFSSFDPDICSLIAMKQNRYPVLFLCVGETRRYEPFHDQRSSTSLASVNFAAGADLLGVNFNSEDLLQDPYPVKRANDLGLISFVWGDDLDKKENIHYFKKELAVDGIIYDRIGEDERRRNVFIVEREQKKALFQAPSGTNSPQRSHSPPAPLDSPTSLSSAATSTTSMNSNSSSSHPPSPMLKSGSGVELIPASNQQLTNSSPRVQISQS